MSAVPGRFPAPSSIRTRFLLVVLAGAVIPLVLIGVWLTRSVVRAGEDLLRTELDKSTQTLADAAEARWSFRRGDLALLANNEVAQRLLATGPQQLTLEGANYLDQLFQSVSQTIPAFEYRDAAGRVRWSTPVLRPDTTDARGQRAAGGGEGPTITVELPVAGSPGAAPLGSLIAHVSVAALVPIDTSMRLPSGAKLQIVQRTNRQALLQSTFPDSLLSRSRFAADGLAWIAVHHSLADPPLDLIVAAPITAYVQPFERVARAGMVTLAVVSLLALGLSAVLTARLTGSLERLAIAADSVAGGDLEHRVEAGGGDEVGRVAAAFNSMMENLRRTLGELSKRQALAAVGEYAAALSHEVRNGLTAVRVDLQHAEEKQADDAPTGPLIARALENVKRLDGTVSASLRSARGGHAPRRRLDLRPVLRSAVQSADGAFSERGAAITPLASNGAPAWVLGDAMALEQLFLNLLLNSAQALGLGGHAAVALAIEGTDWHVVVSDTGVGISPENLDRVLDPFFSTKTDGSGLGLSIARQIAATHGGSLRIASVLGEGTRVDVRLPAAGGGG